MIDKKENERYIAQIFLDIYNVRFKTHFKIVELDESPDVKCRDAESRTDLNLEISMLENLDGDIKYKFGHGARPLSQTTKTDVIDFFMM